MPLVKKVYCKACLDKKIFLLVKSLWYYVYESIYRLRGRI